MLKKAIIWLVIIVTIVSIYDVFYTKNYNEKFKEIPFSEFIGEVKSESVKDATVAGRTITGTLANGKGFSTYFNQYPNLIDLLAQHNVEFKITPEKTVLAETMMDLLYTVIYLGLFFALWYFLMKKMQGGGGASGMGFGRSKAKLLNEMKGKITFADVAGIEEAKEEVTEVVDFLKDPRKFQTLGGRIPRGCLLMGPPGTGKTLLARAIAGEAGVPFFTISGSDFVEMFVGVGASRVRDMFEQGKKNAPCIIFIDEIDAVGRHRGAGLGGGNDEREQTLNQLLVEMDGFDQNESVIIVAATNRPDVLDPALLRPGRFDRQVVIPNPDIKGREEILNVHLKKITKAPDVDARVIARGTPGFSGADLANLVNEAALLAARKDKKVVQMQELEEAKDKVMMGVERKSMVMKDEEKKLTAYHEGGHAIVSIHSKCSDPIHKATIIPRGRALGMVMRLPTDDKYSVTREELKSDLAVAMGGRVAEELIFGYDKVTSGASSDIKHATNLAEHMVREWGMSDEVGTIFYGDPQEEIFLGASLGHTTKTSGTTTLLLEKETKRFVDEGYAKAKKVLEENIDELHALAKALLKYETLSGDEIKAIVKGEEIRINEDIKTTITRKSSVPESKKKDKAKN